MEVNPNIRATGVPKTFDRSLTRPAGKKAQASPTVFAGSEAVDRALQQAPDVRADKVAYAAQLVSDVQYPPLAMIKAISHLLAINLNEGQG